MYAITTKGRRTLAEWLEQPAEPPQFQSEALLRVTFADAGTKDALLDTLRGLRKEGEALRHQFGAQAADYVATGGPFPQRLTLSRSSDDSSPTTPSSSKHGQHGQKTVTEWPATGPASAVPIPHEVFHELIERATSSP